MYTITFRYLGELVTLSYTDDNELLIFSWLEEMAAKGIVTVP
jgi:hypothetical protein